MCQYCGCHENTIIGRLSAEHDALVDLTGDLVRAVDRGDPDTASALALRARDMLHPHTSAEERGLFAALRLEEEAYADTIDRLCGEHTTLDGMIDRIVDGDLSLGREFARGLRDHIDREENSLFPASVVTIIDGDVWDRIEADDAAARGEPAPRPHDHDDHDHDHPHGHTH